MDGTEPAGAVKMPQKRFYRQRAHSNPMSDHVLDCPGSPDEFPVHNLYAEFVGEHPDSAVDMLDVGCGFGGLLVALSPLYNDQLILGMELRLKVSTYVQERIAALRSRHPGAYQNIACVRANAMKGLPFFFKKGQLSKMFFLFPDPHFKKSKHKWRIISTNLLAEYAYVLRVGGIVYVATDVQEYMNWVREHFARHPLFNEIKTDVLASDPLCEIILNSTEEGQKVTRNNGDKFLAAFVRIEDPYLLPMQIQ